jgi:hypothetical protein
MGRKRKQRTARRDTHIAFGRFPPMSNCLKSVARSTRPQIGSGFETILTSEKRSVPPRSQKGVSSVSK